MEPREASSLIVNSTNIDDNLTQENEAIVSYPQNYSLGPTSLRRDHLYVNIYLIYMNVIVNGKHFYIIKSPFSNRDACQIESINSVQNTKRIRFRIIIDLCIKD